MTPLNYNHLYYFFTVAREGSIAKASASLHLTPQTISGQITKFEAQIDVNLFDRKGKTLQLSDMGCLIYSRAEEIFQLGDELSNVLKTQRPISWQTLSVGITDVIPKVLAHQLLKPALKKDKSIRLVCHEGDQISLLASLAVNKLDLIITDQPLQPGGHIKAYTHQIAESGLTFFATKELAGQYREGFSQSLSSQSFLMQSKKSAVRQRLVMWLDKMGVTPTIVAEFDDSALMKSFGQEGYGVFSAPTIIEKYITSQYGVEIIGRAEECIDRYYIISPERKIKHPAVVEIVNSIPQ
jgi:LysR family transcriptional activator of nhaA|tara:strand:- start:2523 stop:3410 length:888 start_codon:yes stop_codon:yes gene_type:complete